MAIHPVLKPRERYTEEVRVLITRTVRDELEALGAQSGLSKAEIVRRCLDIFLSELASDMANDDK